MKKLPLLLSALALALAVVPNVRHYYDKQCHSLGYGVAVFTKDGVACRNISIGLTVPLEIIRERFDKYDCKKPACFDPMPYRNLNT